jgi:hypothetical protein
MKHSTSLSRMSTVVHSTDVALVYDTLETQGLCALSALLMSETFSSRTPRRASPICQMRYYGDEHKSYGLLSFDAV